jgi:hypothetical protein
VGKRGPHITTTRTMVTVVILADRWTLQMKLWKMLRVLKRKWMCMKLWTGSPGFSWTLRKKTKMMIFVGKSLSKSLTLEM